MTHRKKESGFLEIEVTADKGIEVWAPNLETLFVTAVEGMLNIAGLKTEHANEIKRDIDLSAFDLETLLVTFLEEVTFFIEDEKIAFSRFQINISEKKLRGQMFGKKVASIEHDIKAVTFNNLKIINTDSGFSVTIVFDM